LTQRFDFSLAIGDTVLTIVKRTYGRSIYNAEVITPVKVHWNSVGTMMVFLGVNINQAYTET